MNRLLANALAVLNAMLAILFIGAGAVMGFLGAQQVLSPGVELVGLAVGTLAGIILAVLVCGFLALLINIRDELIGIRRALSKVD